MPIILGQNKLQPAAPLPAASKQLMIAKTNVPTPPVVPQTKTIVMPSVAPKATIQKAIELSKPLTPKPVKPLPVPVTMPPVPPPTPVLEPRKPSPQLTLDIDTIVSDSTEEEASEAEEDGYLSMDEADFERLVDERVAAKLMEMRFPSKEPRTSKARTSEAAKGATAYATARNSIITAVVPMALMAAFRAFSGLSVSSAPVSAAPSFTNPYL